MGYDKVNLKEVFCTSLGRTRILGLVDNPSKVNMYTLLVSYSFSLSFKFARFNFAHLVETYSRSFKFARVIFRVRFFWFV